MPDADCLNVDIHESSGSMETLNIVGYSVVGGCVAVEHDDDDDDAVVAADDDGGHGGCDGDDLGGGCGAHANACYCRQTSRYI